MRNFSSFIFFSLFICSSVVFALTPPLSPAQLQEEADLIVEGKVESPVKCLGVVEKNSCSDKKQYSVPMKVQKVLKGAARAGETISIIFYYYDYSKSHCVGDQAAILHSGDEGKYFLKKNPGDNYTPFHWSGAQVSKPGEGALPACP